MFYLIDCAQDSSVLIRTESELIFDREPEVKEKVRFIWKSKSSSKTMEYSGLVLAKSENKQEIVDLEKKFFQEQTLSPKEYGKGLRTKFPKQMNSDDSEESDGDGDTLKEKIKKRKINPSKENKKLEEIKTAKLIAKKLNFPARSPTRFSPRKKSDPVENCNTGTPLKSNMGSCLSCIDKSKKIEQLQRNTKKLKKEKDAAIELSRWLSKARNLATTLEKFSGARPPPATLPVSSEQRDTSLLSGPSEIVRVEPELKLDLYNERVENQTDPQQLEIHQHEMSKSPQTGTSKTLNVETPSSPTVGMDEHTQFKYTASDMGVTKLHGEYNVYILSNVKQRIIKFSRTHTQFARNAMEAIFTDEALQNCSLQGKSTSTARQGLDADGFAAVLDFAEHYAQEKKMKIEDTVYVKKQLSTRLCEIRKSAKNKK